ncbi:MAG: LicD family protein [Lachnospiraceae bacterium]|nr:LicD family protein [Lachnospiraceae bacterium]
MELHEKFYEEEVRCGYLVTQKMKKVWAVGLNLLEQFDKICQAHGLRYYACYGTLLGAVRHQGFIPWDDDIDVAMFRDDYERLKLIAQEEISYPYFLQNSYNDSMIWAFSKLRDGRTTAIEFSDAPPQFHQGIFIDIFPLDDVPDGVAMKPVITKMQSEIWMSVVDPEGLKQQISQGRKLAMDTSILLELLGMQIRERMKMFEDFNAARFGKSSRIGFLMDYFNGVPSMLREWYDDTVYLPFEGLEVPAPSGYASFLESYYGDYMTPVRAQSLHEGIFFDPDKPYTHYMNKK